MAQARDIIDAMGLTEGDRVLEVGGGDGSVAVCVSQMSGAEVVVVEASEAMREVIEGRGLRAVASVADAGDGFGVAFCLHVIEHHHDPIAELSALRARMAPGGRLFARVPDLLGAEGLMQTWLDEAHLQHYTDATLIATLKRAGWDAWFCRGSGGELTALAQVGEPMAITPRVDAAEVVEFVRERVRVGEREMRDAQMGERITRYLRGEDMPHDEVREAVRAMRTRAVAQARAWIGMREGLANMVRELDAMVDTSEAAHDDEGLRFAAVVRANVLAAAAAMAGHLLNWCVMRETE